MVQQSNFKSITSSCKLPLHELVIYQAMKFIQSIYYALQGITTFFSTERNGKIQLIVMCCTILLAFWLKISNTNVCILLICCSVVIGMEMLNTSIEHLCNDYCPTKNSAIKTIKDISAGAVLWASLLSVIIGGIIFFEPIIKIFYKN